MSPRGENGFGWDQIFIPYFSNKTSAELDETEYERFYTEEKPFQIVREFLLKK
jgi:inosine/xanthosine triphosphate pyrophosphatase family protein